MAAVDQKAEQGRVATAPPGERPVTEQSGPSNRTGSGDPMSVDQAVPCADERADMTAPFNCASRTRGTNAAYAPEALGTCRNRLDSSGHVIYEASACVGRYRTQMGTQMGSSFQNVDYSRENAYFDRYMDKAVKHARQAEIAADQGHSAEMMRHAQLSLDQAKEAQRAGNVPGLVEGITELRETLHHGEDMQWRDSMDHVRYARLYLSEAAGMKPTDIRLATTPAGTTRMVNRKSRTVTGELVGDAATTGPDGNRQYVLRDRNGQETRIVITPDMNPNLKAGDKVQAMLDPDGRVVAINKEE